MTQPPPALNNEAARELLKAAGLRCTSCRVAVLRSLAAAPKPITHAEVARELADEVFDQSTVFRCLNELADKGLAKRLDLGDHLWRYELARTAAAEHHAHFMCTECGTVSCVPELNVGAALKNAPETQGLGQVTEMLLKGRCADCAEEK